METWPIKNPTTNFGRAKYSRKSPAGFKVDRSVRAFLKQGLDMLRHDLELLGMFHPPKFRPKKTPIKTGSMASWYFFPITNDARKQWNVSTRLWVHIYMGASLNGGTLKSSILIGFSIINHPFWGSAIFGNTHIQMFKDSIFKYPMIPFLLENQSCWSKD